MILCINLKKNPSELTIVKTVPLPKSRDKRNPSNITFVLSKFLDKYVHIHLNDSLFGKSYNSIIRFSLGLDVIYSCNTVLARLTHSWLTAMGKPEMSGVVFLDLKKAFDLV